MGSGHQADRDLPGGVVRNGAGVVVVAPIFYFLVVMINCKRFRFDVSCSHSGTY